MQMNTQPAGQDVAQTPQKIPMRSRMRTALAGGRPPGTAFFDSAEHWAVVDGLRLTLADGSSHDAAHFEFTMSNGVRLSFGQIIALAGDFYAIAREPISDQPDTQAAFRANFAHLDGADPKEVKAIVAIMQEEFRAIGDAIAKGEPPHEAYSKNSSRWDRQYNVATGGKDSALYYLDTDWWGRYMWIASFNWDHFGAHAQKVYQAGLQVAMATAVKAAAAKGQQRDAGLLRAYTQLAFACHYLTDGFAGGHLRTPRRHLHDFTTSQNAAADFASDVCAKVMHGEDGFNGLWVRNAAGDHWIAYGDDRYFDSVNAANRNVMRAALRAAIADVRRAFTEARVPAAPASLRLLPILPLDPNSADNHSPLFISRDGERMAELRRPAYDLSARKWHRPLDPWLVLALSLNNMTSTHVGSPPHKGQASGPNTGASSATSWIVQARLMQRPGHPLTTQASPAIAEFKGERWVCVKQGSQLLVGRHGSEWSDFEVLKASGDPVQTSTGACLVVHGEVLHCFHADFEGGLQWLQWHGNRWMRHGSVQVGTAVARSDRTPCAVSLPKAGVLLLVFKGYRSSELFWAWRFRQQSEWLGNVPVPTPQGYAAMTDNQPSIAATREGAFVYFQAHNGQSVFSMWVDDAPTLDPGGNTPITTIDGRIVWTSAAVAAAASPTGTQVQLVMPHDGAVLRGVTQQTIGDTTQRQYVPGDIDAADGELLQSVLTPGLALIDGRYWMLSVDPSTQQVVLSFGQP